MDRDVMASTGPRPAPAQWPELGQHRHSVLTPSPGWKDGPSPPTPAFPGEQPRGGAGGFREPYRGVRSFSHVRKSCWKLRASTRCRSAMQCGCSSNSEALLPRGTRVMETLFRASLQCWKVPVPESMGTDTAVVLSTQKSWSPSSRENPFSFPGGQEGKGSAEAGTDGWAQGRGP